MGELLILIRAPFQFQTYEEPIQAVISDSQTSIQVTFAASAVSKYTAATRKRITDGTRGGLVQIRAFEIVATHYGPKQSRLTLLIKDFQSLGSDGSGTFGNPVPIGSRQDIRVPLFQLGELRAQEPTNSQPHSGSGDDATAADIRSQATDGSSDDEVDVVTQVAFATQRTRREYNGKCRSDMAIPPKRTNQTDALISNAASRESSVNLLRPGTGSNSNHRDLLNLLTTRNRSGRVLTSTVTSDPSLDQRLSKASRQDNEDNPKVLDQGHSAFPDSLARNEAARHTMAPETILTATQPAQAVSMQSPGLVSDQFPKDLQDQYLDASDTQSLAVAREPTMHRSGTDLSDGHLNKESENLSEDALPAGSDASPLEMDYNGTDADEHPWVGLTKISRRDVMISQDQQALLDRQDSWLPPEPGHRGPVANVPIAILQSLNALAERRAAQERRNKRNRQPPQNPDGRRMKESTPVSISSDDESEEEQDSDVAVSSSEWPQSSPPPLLKRDELPPDSSAASPEPPDTRYLAVKAGTPGRDVVMPSRRRSKSSPHDVPTQYQTFGSSPHSNGLLGQQRSRHNEGNIASTGGSLHKPVEQPSIQLITGSIPQSEAWAHQLETAARAQTIAEGSSWARSGTVSRDVTPSKRNAHLGLAAEISMNILSEDDEMSDSDDSFLETSVPLALDNQPKEVDAVSDTRTATSHAYPSTVSQDDKTIIQVKRTPNANGQISKQPIMQLASEPLHITEDGGLLLESQQAKRLSDEAVYSDPVVPGTFDAPPKHQPDNVDSTTLAIDVADSQNATYDEEALVNQQIRSEVDAQSVRSTSVSPVKHNIASPELQVTGQSAIQVIPFESPTRAVSDTKRKAKDYHVLSPNITKRRKRFRPRPAFESSQDQEEIQDPAVLVRQQRREFFASRKESMLQSTTRLSLEVQQDEAFEAEELTTDLSEATKEDEDVMMLDHQGVDMDLGSDLTQTHDMTFKHEPMALDTLEKRSYLARQPNIPKATVEVGSTDAVADVEDHVVKVFETGAAIASTTGSIYDRFLATYPEYTGDLKHFVAMAKKIDTLCSADRMEHHFLWDDFIARHKMEYGQYLLDCMERAEDPIPYEGFYRIEIHEPRFMKKVITPSNLADVLALSGLASHTGQPQRSGIDRPPAYTIPSPASRGHRSQSRDDVVIDLTADIRVDQRGAEPKISTPVGSVGKRPRPIPWAKSALELDISPPGRRKAAGGSVVSSRSLPLTFPSQARFGLPISASNSPLRPRSAHSDVPPLAAQRKEPLKPTKSSGLFKDGHLSTTQPNRSPVTDWLDKTSAHAVDKERAPPSTADWWADLNAPFKSFARAYGSIESGKGNSFAKPGVQGHKKLGEIDSEGLIRPRERELDVLKWKV